MKVIYNDILTGLNPLIQDNTLRWVDWDKGQLKKKDGAGRYPVAYPCALVSITIGSTSDLTDTIQDCRATVSVTLAFDPLSYGRTAANASENIREQGLEPYEVIAKIYSLLQGYSTEHFDCLSRQSAGEVTHADLFLYRLTFRCDFEDETAEG